MVLVKSYVNSKRKSEKIGMISEIVHLDEDTSEEDVLKRIRPFKQ